jgi:hypothetical protein
MKSVSLEDVIEDVATRCNKVELNYADRQWSCRFHHKSGIVCYGIGDTLESAVRAAKIHGTARAKELRQKGWVF